MATTQWTGRPTKLTDEMITLAEEYVTQCEDTGVHSLLPTVERLALILHISRDSCYEWSNVPDAAPPTSDLDASRDYNLRQQFSDILSRLKAAQADKLMQNSLLNRYNPTIAKLLLSSKHGYVEKSETDVTTKGGALPGTQDTQLAAEFSEFLKQQTKG